MTNMRKGLLALAAGVAMCMGNAHADQIKVTFTNQFATGGLTTTPLWVAFHNGSFDLFNSGEEASGGLEDLAELGATAGLNSELAAAQGDGSEVSGGIGAGAFPPVEPGETGSAVFSLDPTSNRFFNFAAMIVPSNDAFIGNGGAIELFNAMGGFVGPFTITILGGQIWDAGTEINDPSVGPAFLPGVNAADSPEENGVVALHTGLNDFAGLTGGNGQIINGDLIDFIADPSLIVATIEVSRVSEPATGLVFALGGLALFAAARRRRET